MTATTSVFSSVVRIDKDNQLISILYYNRNIWIDIFTNDYLKATTSIFGSVVPVDKCNHLISILESNQNIWIELFHYLLFDSY